MDDLQIVVVGDNNAGKTSLCVTFSTGQFPSLFTPMECNRVSHEKDLTVDGETVHVKCVDTEGHEDYDQSRPDSYPDTSVFIICFSISGPTSLQNVKDKWLPELKKHAPKVPIMLLGCKADLRRGHDTENLVTINAAKKICKQIKAKCYMECSSLKNTGVEDCITEAAYIALGKSRSGGGCGCVIL